MTEIKKGEQVQLKSGGPVMSVQEVDDYAMSHGIENGALCVWFDGPKPMEKVFDCAVLSLYTEPSKSKDVV